MEKITKLMDEQITKLNALKIEEPTLKQLRMEADEFFFDSNCSERKRMIYLQGLMAQKIVDLERDIENLKRQVR